MALLSAIRMTQATKSVIHFVTKLQQGKKIASKLYSIHGEIVTTKLEEAGQEEDSKEKKKKADLTLYFEIVDFHSTMKLFSAVIRSTCKAHYSQVLLELTCKESTCTWISLSNIYSKGM